MSASSDPLDTAYAALSNAKRRSMLLALAYRPATISQLAEEHGLSLPAIHRHIETLAAAGLIQRRKVGRTNFVALRRPALRLAQEWLSRFHTEWGGDQETLENYLQELTNH